MDSKRLEYWSWLQKAWRGRSVTRVLRLLCISLCLAVVAAQVSSTDFIEQRRKFRDEIRNKVETSLDKSGKFVSIIFKGEEKKYDFKISQDDRKRLKDYAREYFSCNDDALLDKILDELNTGRFVVFKEFQEDGVNLKVLFLSPRAKYWEWLTDINGIETMFHTYNFSVGLLAPDKKSRYVVLQTEGSFLGITQSVSLPVYFWWEHDQRTMSWKMPTQKEINEALKKMPAVTTGRTAPDQKFLDACRTHPFFQQKKDGEYVVSDEDIMELYKTTITDMDEECPVKECVGHWRIHEDYPFLVVDYSLKTSVNINAFIPPSLRFMAGTVEDLAQSISDEVSVKYMPLSMKNFRDHTQLWTKTGGPK